MPLKNTPARYGAVSKFLHRASPPFSGAAAVTDAAGRRSSLRSTATGVAALLLVNGALTFDNVWPTPAIVPDWKLSVEAAALLGLLAVSAAWRRPAGDGAIRLLAGLLTGMALLRYIDVTMPALFGRPINLFWDARHLPQVIVMAASGQPWWRPLLIGSGSLLAVAAAAWLLHRGAAWSLRQLSGWLQSAAGRGTAPPPPVRRSCSPCSWPAVCRRPTRSTGGSPSRCRHPTAGSCCSSPRHCRRRPIGCCRPAPRSTAIWRRCAAPTCWCCSSSRTAR